MIKYEWDALMVDMEKLVGRISARLVGDETTISTIVGVARGGLIPAVMLSHRFNAPIECLKWQTRDQGLSVDSGHLLSILASYGKGQAVVIVDDIADSGKTFAQIQGVVRSFSESGLSPVRVYYAALLQRWSCEVTPSIIAGKTVYFDDWIRFPWE